MSVLWVCIGRGAPTRTHTVICIQMEYTALEVTTECHPSPLDLTVLYEGVLG